MMTTTKLGLFVLLTAVAACNSSPPKGEGTSVADPIKQKPGAKVDKPVAPVTPDEIVAPREGKATLVPTDYAATEGPFRLYGVEPGEGDDALARTAVIADAKTWSVRVYRVGDLLGRGLVLSKIDEDKVTLRGASGDILLEPGVDAQLRVVRHRLDVVASPLGRHRFALDLDAANAAPATLPSVEATELYGGPVLKLGAIEPGSLLAEAGFLEGDLLASVQGTAANSDTLSVLVGELTSGTGAFKVGLIRAGVPIEQVYIRASR